MMRIHATRPAYSLSDDSGHNGHTAAMAFVDVLNRWSKADAGVHDGPTRYTARDLIAAASEMNSDPADEFPKMVASIVRLIRSAWVGTEELLFDPAEFPDPRGSERRVGFWVMTSGTTGRPKPKFWSWEALLLGVPIPESHDRPMVLSHYPLPYFAGVQGLLHGVMHEAEIHCLARPPAAAEAQAWDTAESLHLLGTPSQFRMALGGVWPWRRDAVSLIAMGGEAADQPLLDALHSVAQGARLAHTYATAEHGTLFAVTDGRAGFDTSLLGLATRNGKRLVVESKALFVEDHTGRHGTGDLVEIHKDRVYFTGRAGRTVNLAGQVVDLSYVESALRDDHEIRALRVEGRPNAASGVVLIAHIEAAPGADGQALERRLRARATTRLGYVARPRRYLFHDHLPVSSAGKLPLTIPPKVTP